MEPCGIITLTTDFGYDDPFAGQMKGAILSIRPDAVIVDVTHGIRAHDIAQGAFVIAGSYDAFPEGTIHVCVVDPTVGSKRRGIIVSAGNHLFIGPDNGLFSQVIGRSGSYCAVEITNGQYVRACAGPTFHGRDVFAPAAAWLSKGVELLEFGPTVDDLCLTDLQIPEEDGTGISGQVVYFDRFGNAITNIRKERIDSRGASISGIRWNETSVSMAPHYAAAGDRGLHALFNSSGYLELFVNRNDAATRYGIRKGDRVTIALSPSPDIPSAET